MSDEKKNVTEEKAEIEELNLDDIEEVTGGGAFSDIPRVQTHKIDDELKSKI